MTGADDSSSCSGTFGVSVCDDAVAVKECVAKALRSDAVTGRTAAQMRPLHEPRMPLNGADVVHAKALARQPPRRSIVRPSVLDRFLLKVFG